MGWSPLLILASWCIDDIDAPTFTSIEGVLSNYPDKGARRG
jgi:hypothetical protein